MSLYPNLSNSASVQLRPPLIWPPVLSPYNLFSTKKRNEKSQKQVAKLGVASIEHWPNSTVLYLKHNLCRYDLFL
ncbi:CLUMA_CG014613, isoform A [Clunio marinus]|uniref:CLUMA_CG014613, isoform A n=1 Tax=Clunio marinus TaxID=568069 RepID=A0A1J1ISX6_9DIPT|nr:CLUMA_CG014613, isoform A [Clunio marinus]